MKLTHPIALLALALLFQGACMLPVEKKAENSNAPKETSEKSDKDKEKPKDEKSPKETTQARNDNQYTHQEGGIGFEAPDKWAVEPDGDRLTMSTPDDTMSVVLMVAQQKSIDEALGALDKELGKIITDIRRDGPPTENKIDGMPLYSLQGTGKYNGTPITWGVDLIEAKKPVIVLTLAEKSAWAKYSGDYQKFAGSIHKA